MFTERIPDQQEGIMRLAKTIDELYEEVKDYDMVLCNDAPLALALNNRLDYPVIGRFALTPRQLAMEIAPEMNESYLMNDVKAVRKLSELSKKPMRFVHGEIENFQLIRRYTNEVRNCLHSNIAREIYDNYRTLWTADEVMERFDAETTDVFNNKKIAVIGLELFDSLDRRMLPKEFDEIDIFKRWKDKYSVPEFRELGNDRQIAENVASLITPDNAHDTAIVMDVSSPIADAVRSALYRRKLPFKNKLSISDLDSIRNFIEFLNRSLSFSTIKVSHVRELISAYGGSIGLKYSDYLLEQFTKTSDGKKCSARTRELFDVMENIRDMTYLEVCNKVAAFDGAQIKLLLEQLSLEDTKVSLAVTADIVYAVGNFSDIKHNEQIPMNEKEGVLLVDCKKSVYIDRPIVYYLGMGTEWENDLRELNLINSSFKDDIIEKNTQKFQILLQQGSRRIYIINSTKNGKKPKPCNMFEQSERQGLLDTVTYTTFDEIGSPIVSGSWTEGQEEKEFVRRPVGKKADMSGFRFSKTSYNRFVSCPRSFMYGLLLNAPDSSYTVLGNVLHEYLEFRMCCPEEAKMKTPEDYVKAVADECVPLYSPEIRDIQESYIRSCIRSIDNFVESNGFSERVRMTKRSTPKDNRFMKEIGKDDLESQMNEIPVVSKDASMYAIIDIFDGDHIFDLKTGNPKEVKNVLQSMDLKKGSTGDYPAELQGLFYLSMVEESLETDAKFTLFFASANHAEQSAGIEVKPEKAFVDIAVSEGDEDTFRKYFLDYNPSRAVIRTAKKYEEFVTKSNLLDAIVDFGLVPKELRSPSAASYLLHTIGLKDGKTNLKNATDLMNAAAQFIENMDLFLIGRQIIVSRKRLKEFRSEVSKACEYVKNSGTYDPIPIFQCKNCEFISVCTKEPLEAAEDDSE